MRLESRSVEDCGITSSLLRLLRINALGKAVLGSQQGRPLGCNILYALIPLLVTGIEAVTFAGNEIPVGIRIRCLLDCIRNAKQHLGLALIGAARQKQRQTDNGKASFPAAQKSYQNKVSNGCAIITPSTIRDTAHRIDRSCCGQSSSGTRRSTRLASR